MIEPDVNIESPTPEADAQVTEVPPSDVRRTRSGRISVSPSRLVEDHNWQ